MSKRIFRVVTTLNFTDFHNCFTECGKLKANHKDKQRYTSLRAAVDAARCLTDGSGYYAFIIRRLRSGGWEQLGYCTDTHQAEYVRGVE